MGDSGALVIGLLIGFLTLKMLSFDVHLISLTGFNPENTFPIIMAILFVPFFDTSRSILIRILDGKSPFAPDRNHTHHLLLDAGCSHLKATLLLGFINLCVVSLVFATSSILGSLAMSFMMLGIFILNFGLFYFIKNKFVLESVASVVESGDGDKFNDNTISRGNVEIKVEGYVKLLAEEKKVNLERSLEEKEAKEEHSKREVVNY